MLLVPVICAAIIVVVLTFMLITSCCRSGVLSCSSGDRRRCLLVVRNFNPEAGFWWMVYNALHAMHRAASEPNMRCLVYFDSGLYLEKQGWALAKLRQECDPSNWFDYYFEQRATSSSRETLRRMATSQRWPSFTRYPNDMRPYAPFYEGVYEWDRDAFNQCRRPDIVYRNVWNSQVRVRPWIRYRVSQFFNKHMNGCYCIGIHYRGTDKYGVASGHEDFPIHYEYDFCTDLIQEEMDKHAGEDIRVLACSDEQPFVDHCIERLGAGIVISTSAARSPISTSGLHLKSGECKDAGDTRPDCLTYYQSKRWSLHRGDVAKTVTRYQLGEDVLVDVLLLSSCSVFFKSRGNVSNFPGYLNPDSLRVVDMSDEYKKK